MASKVIVTREARRDLVSIVGYLVDDLDARQAASDFMDAFAAVASRIKEYPGLYPLCPDESLARRGIRKALAGGYVVLYKNAENVSYVMRVFHQSQDYARIV